MPVLIRTSRALLVTVLLTALLSGSLAVRPAPAAASTSGKVWTVVIVAVALCLWLPKGPCHPLGLAQPPGGPSTTALTTKTDAEPAAQAQGLGAALESGTPVHLYTGGRSAVREGNDRDGAARTNG